MSSYAFCADCGRLAFLLMSFGSKGNWTRVCYECGDTRRTVSRLKALAELAPKTRSSVNKVLAKYGVKV